MEFADIIGGARRAAGLSQDGLARMAGTSRTTLSAYEHGRKSPTLATATRILAEAGFELSFEPRIRFVEREVGRGRTTSVPTVLPRLRTDAAIRTVSSLPLHLNWSDPRRAVDLRDRRQRARLYERVIRDGTADDVVAYIDGVLLSDLWPELVLPVAVRRAWEAALPVLVGREGTP